MDSATTDAGTLHWQVFTAVVFAFRCAVHSCSGGVHALSCAGSASRASRKTCTTSCHKSQAKWISCAYHRCRPPLLMSTQRTPIGLSPIRTVLSSSFTHRLSGVVARLRPQLGILCKACGFHQNDSCWLRLSFLVLSCLFLRQSHTLSCGEMQHPFVDISFDMFLRIPICLFLMTYIVELDALVVRLQVLRPPHPFWLGDPDPPASTTCPSCGLSLVTLQPREIIYVPVCLKAKPRVSTCTLSTFGTRIRRFEHRFDEPPSSVKYHPNFGRQDPCH